MTRHFRHPDMDAHEPGCQEIESGEPCADPNSAYIDVFCACHRYTEPKILMNGTDVAWPAGWSQEQATAWRGDHGLLPPVGEQVAVGKPMPQAGPEDDPGQVNPVPPESGLIPESMKPVQSSA
jgi:hypothetical protein